jgi:hypothetical protein
MWGHTHPGVVVNGHTISHGRCAVFGGGGIGHTELQAQTHQKSVSWNVPEAGLAHDPRRGNLVRFYYILTSCEPHRFFNRRDNARARVFFLARLGLKSTV